MLQKYGYPLSLLCLLAFIILAWVLMAGPPKVRDAHSPADTFSAERAFAELTKLLDGNTPHPTGSKANQLVRDKITSRLNALGVQVEIQSGLSCSSKYAGCAEVDNIIGIQKGNGKTDKAIMLATHYDSVPAGPGAGDDGSGVAASLEIARILSGSPKLENDVIYLITDGEETGLRGADLFAKEHPLMKQVGIVINLEARGVTGTSSMFETGPGNLKIIDMFGRATRHPSANSLSYEIYQRMPNDTDFSVYKKAGAQGLNFAFAGGASLYHSRRDDLEHLNKRSLQHHGDNALGLILAFGNHDLDAISASANATYFDLFSSHLIVWPSSWNVPMAALVLLFITVMIFRQLKFSPKAIGVVVLAVLGLFVLPVAFGWLLSFPLGRWPQMHPLDHPYPWPGRFALLSASVLVALIVGKISSRWCSPRALMFGSYWIMAVLALMLALLVGGGTYMMLVPAMMFALGLGIDLLRKRENLPLAAHLGFAGAAYMAIYHFFILDLVVNFPMSQAKIAPLVLLVLALTPLLARHWRQHQMKWRHAMAATLFVVLLSTIVGTLVPGFNESHPRAQNLIYKQNNETSEIVWISRTIGGPDKTFLDAAGFTGNEKNHVLNGAFGSNLVFKDAKNRNLPAPVFELGSDSTEDGLRTITGTIRSARNARTLYFGFRRNAAPVQMKIEGQVIIHSGENAPRVKNRMYIDGAGQNAYQIEIITDILEPLIIILGDSQALDDNETEGMSALLPLSSAPAYRGNRSEVLHHIKVGSE